MQVNAENKILGRNAVNLLLYGKMSINITIAIREKNDQIYHHCQDKVYI